MEESKELLSHATAKAFKALLAEFDSQYELDRDEVPETFEEWKARKASLAPKPEGGKE